MESSLTDKLARRPVHDHRERVLALSKAHGEILAEANAKRRENIIKKKAFYIKLNKCASNDPCWLCGERTDSMASPEVYVDGTWDRLCHVCAHKHAPELEEVSLAFIALKPWDEPGRKKGGESKTQ